MVFITMIGWILLLLFPLYGMRRGAGASFFMLLYVVLLLCLLPPLGLGLGTAFHFGLHHSSGHSVGVWRLVLLIPLLGAAFPLTMYLQRFFPWNFEPFDWMPGLLLGLIAGFLAANMFLVSCLLTYEKTPRHDALNRSLLVREVVHLQGWRALEDWMTNLSRQKEEIHVPE